MNSVKYILTLLSVAATLGLHAQYLAGSTVTFNATTEVADYYEWNFGDGGNTTETDMSVNHTYDTYGQYTVTLVEKISCPGVPGGYEKDTIVDTVYVETNFQNYITYGENPSSGIDIEVTIPHNTTSSLYVKNSSGLTVETYMDGFYSEGVYDYDLNGHESGNYYLMWEIENQVYSFTLILE